MSTVPVLRIEADGVIGWKTRVFYLEKDADGNEVTTDISDAVSAVDVQIRVGEINRARLEMVRVGGHIHAELVEVVVRDLARRKRRWWLRWRRQPSRAGVYEVCGSSDRQRLMRAMR